MKEGLALIHPSIDDQLVGCRYYCESLRYIKHVLCSMEVQVEVRRSPTNVQPHLIPVFNTGRRQSRREKRRDEVQRGQDKLAVSGGSTPVCSNSEAVPRPCHRGCAPRRELRQAGQPMSTGPYRMTPPDKTLQYCKVWTSRSTNIKYSTMNCHSSTSQPTLTT